MEKIENCSFYRVLIKNRILVFNSNNNRAMGVVPELLSMNYIDYGAGWYKRIIDPSEIEAAYCLEGTYTNYKGYEVEIIKCFEPAEYMVEVQNVPDRYTPVVNRFFEPDGQCVFRLEFGRYYNIQAVKELGLKLSYEDTHLWDKVYLLDVLDDEIPDVWQIRKPVEGFPMLGEEKVYIKKDGVWLPRKEYGSKIDED